METTERVCNAQWGEEPLLQSGTGAVRCELCSAPQRAARSSPALSAHLPHPVRGQVRWESAPSPAHSTTSSVGTALLMSTPSRRPDSRQSLFQFKRCWHCEPEYGESEEVCVAIRALDSLEADVEEHDAEVQHAEEARPPHRTLVSTSVAVASSTAPLGRWERMPALRVAPPGTTCIASGSTWRTAGWASASACGSLLVSSSSSVTAIASLTAPVVLVDHCMVLWAGTVLRIILGTMGTQAIVRQRLQTKKRMIECVMLLRCFLIVFDVQQSSAMYNNLTNPTSTTI